MKKFHSIKALIFLVSLFDMTEASVPKTFRKVIYDKCPEGMYLRR